MAPEAEVDARKPVGQLLERPSEYLTVIQVDDGGLPVGDHHRGIGKKRTELVRIEVTAWPNFHPLAV